jgi:hypothetical protein
VFALLRRIAVYKKNISEEYAAFNLNLAIFCRTFEKRLSTLNNPVSAIGDDFQYVFDLIQSDELPYEYL